MQSPAPAPRDHAQADAVGVPRHGEGLGVGAGVGDELRVLAVAAVFDRRLVLPGREVEDAQRAHGAEIGPVERKLLGARERCAPHRGWHVRSWAGGAGRRRARGSLRTARSGAARRPRTRRALAASAPGRSPARSLRLGTRAACGPARGSSTRQLDQAGCTGLAARERHPAPARAWAPPTLQRLLLKTVHIARDAHLVAARRRAAGWRAAEIREGGCQAAETREGGRQAAATREAGWQAAETRTAGRQAAETRTAGRQAAETRTAGRQAAETRTAGRQAAETRTAGRQAAETRTAGRQATENRLSQVAGCLQPAATPQRKPVNFDMTRNDKLWLPGCMLQTAPRWTCSPQRSSIMQPGCTTCSKESACPARWRATDLAEFLGAARQPAQAAAWRPGLVEATGPVQAVAGSAGQTAAAERQRPLAGETGPARVAARTAGHQAVGWAGLALVGC